jgi:chaperonin cofactor prefoldin
MTIKEEVEQLKKEIEYLRQQGEDSAKQIKQLKKELSEQNNKWNKVLAYASIVSATATSFSLLIA